MDPAEALDEVLAAFFDSEQRDFEEAVAPIQRGYENVLAGPPSSSPGFPAPR